MKATFERPAKFQKEAPLPDRARAKDDALKREDFERELRRERDRDRAMREKSKDEPKRLAGEQQVTPAEKEMKATKGPANAGAVASKASTTEATKAESNNTEASNAEGALAAEKTPAAENASAAEETTAVETHAGTVAMEQGANAASPEGEEPSASGTQGESALDIANENAHTGTFNRPPANPEGGTPAPGHHFGGPQAGPPGGRAIASSLANPSTTAAAAENAASTRETKIGGAAAHASDFRDFERARKQGSDASDVSAPALPAMSGDTAAAEGFRPTTSTSTVAGSAAAAASASEAVTARHEANIHAANMVTLARSSHAEVDVAGMGRIAVRASRRDEGVDIDIRAASVQTQALLHASRVDLVHEVRHVVRTGEVNIGLYDGSGLENASRDASESDRRGENSRERDGEASSVTTSADVRNGVPAARPGRVRIVL